MLPRTRLSIIVPFYNEAESIEPMYRAIVAAMQPLAIPYEMVFVDDGSKDTTLALASKLARDDARIRVVQFRRNSGQTAAISPASSRPTAPAPRISMRSAAASARCVARYRSWA